MNTYPNAWNIQCLHPCLVLPGFLLLSLYIADMAICILHAAALLCSVQNEARNDKSGMVQRMSNHFTFSAHDVVVCVGFFFMCAGNKMCSQFRYFTSSISYALCQPRLDWASFSCPLRCYFGTSFFSISVLFLLVIPPRAQPEAALEWWDRVEPPISKGTCAPLPQLLRSPAKLQAQIQGDRLVWIGAMQPLGQA